MIDVDADAVVNADAVTYCTRPPTGNWLADVIQSGYCGASEAAGSVLGGTVGTAAGVVTAGQREAGRLGSELIDAGGTAFGEAQETVRTVANPLNLFAGGAGLAVGAVVVGLAGAAAADVYFTGGSGVRSLLGKRR